MGTVQGEPFYLSYPRGRKFHRCGNPIKALQGENTPGTYRTGDLDHRSHDCQSVPDRMLLEYPLEEIQRVEQHNGFVYLVERNGEARVSHL